MNQYEFEKTIRPLDCICTVSNSALAKMIRFVTAHRVRKNGFVEAFRMKIANHTGLIVEENGILKVAEMLKTGLEFNPVSDYFIDKNDRVLAVRRHHLLTDRNIYKLNEFIKQVHYTGTLKYSVKELFNFIYEGLKIPGSVNVPSEMYCSEFCEIVVNSVGLSWGVFNLRNRNDQPSGISPCEIQFGGTLRVYDE